MEELDEVMAQVTAKHKSRSRKSVGYPSFSRRMDQRIRQRRLLLKYTDATPVTYVLTRKTWRDRICSRLGFPVPEKLLEDGSLEDALGLVREHGHVVVKPVVGAGSRGVVPLVPAGWRYRDVRTERTLSLSRLERELREVRVSDRAVKRWSVERLILGDSNASGHPMDYKLYMFRQRCGMVFQVKRHDGPAKYRYMDAQWNDLDVGRDEARIDRSLPRPRDRSKVENLAQSIALEIPTSFMRIDLMEGRDGVYLSEVSPLPGRYNSLAKLVDQRLGLLWEMADAEFQLEDPGQFEDVLRVMREESGRERLVPD